MNALTDVTDAQASKNAANDLWRETNKTLSEQEQRSQELSLLVQTAKTTLDATKAEIESVDAMKRDVDGQLAKAESALAVSLTEKERLNDQAVKSAEDLTVLNRQLRLLSSAAVEAERKLLQERESLQKELALQRARLEKIVFLASTTEA